MKKKLHNLQSLSFMRNLPIRVGIFGGTFEPAHEGHLMISLNTLKEYGFDYIIWLVANQNPFKPRTGRDIFMRAGTALKVATHPRIIVSTAEYDLGTYHSYDSLEKLTQRFPLVKFSWLMGIDNLVHLRRWHRHREIQKLCDIIVFDRMTSTRLVNNLFFDFKTTPPIDKTVINNIIISRRILCKTSSTEIRLNGYYDR